MKILAVLIYSKNNLLLTLLIASILSLSISTQQADATFTVKNLGFDGSAESIDGNLIIFGV